MLFSLPDWLPLLGGPVTLEALIYGALNGAGAGGHVRRLTAINRALPVRSLLRLVPRAYYPLAVVMSIAITFVPGDARSTCSRSARRRPCAASGCSGVRSWLPLVVPLLEGGMERSMQLAEAMMARGFASGEQAPDARPQALDVGRAGRRAGRLAAAPGLAARQRGTLLLLAGGPPGRAASGWLAGAIRTPSIAPSPGRGATASSSAARVVAAAGLSAPLAGLDRARCSTIPTRLELAVSSGRRRRRRWAWRCRRTLKWRTYSDVLQKPGLYGAATL